MNDNQQQSVSQGGFIGFIKSIFGHTEQSLEDTVKEAIAEHEEDAQGSALGDGEKEMLYNVLQYGELRVNDVMVPRADIIALDMATEFKEMLTQFAEAAHSRMPLYRDTLDEVQGMIHVKDVLRVLVNRDDNVTLDNTTMINILRPVLYVPASMKVIDLLAKMRAVRTHMAVVVDEYGGTDGLVTIEDLVEEIVGEIEDEHDEDQANQIRALEGGAYLVDARIELDDLQDALGINFVDDEDMEEIDTLAGLVFDMAGKVPEIGELISHKTGIVFEVVDADPRRIKQIRIHPFQDDLVTVSQ